MTLKIAVLAPMPIASVSTATPVKTGIRARLRRIWFNRIGLHTAVGGEGFSAIVATLIKRDSKSNPFGIAIPAIWKR